MRREKRDRILANGGQAYPVTLFPGMEVTSSFFDGVVANYAPSLPEILLGVGGVGLALAMVVVAVKVLAFLPESLDNSLECLNSGSCPRT